MLKVFLVEDESVIREGLRDKIPWEQYGFRFAGEAADGEMALPLIRKVKPDVLITDIKMPFMDGLSLSKIVSAEFPKTRIIIISGYDDFEYARQAIRVGVDQYLLKPVTRLILKNALMEVKEKIEQDAEQQDYQAQFQQELHVYEQFARRHFFERMLEGDLTVTEIYEEAAKQSLEITAPCYNLLFFYLQEKSDGFSEKEGDRIMRRQEELLHYFLRYPQYILFRWNVNSYGVLVKSEAEKIGELMERCTEHIRRLCMAEEEHFDWYIAVGKPVERLSMLPECFQGVNHHFAYRFVVPKLHILTEETLSHYMTAREQGSINSVEPSKIDAGVIREFLSRGNTGEIYDFVDSYLGSIREALESRMFRAYVVLNIRFTVISFVESLGGTKEECLGQIPDQTGEMEMSASEIPEYFAGALKAAIDIRESESSNQNRKLLRKALEYIDENYKKETLSLNVVADEVNVSANYFSAVFSQNMQKTFVEYVTGKRMEKAKKLLKETGKSTGEIAAEVGYKDPHYFSFVFRKTQGCSPREYRGKKN